MKVYKSYLDSISIGISALCVVHCIVLPIFLSTLPLWGVEVLENSAIEAITILSTLLAGGWAIGKGYWKYHQHLFIPVLFTAGLFSMMSANFMQTEVLEMLLKGSGAILIVSAHVVNWKKCSACCNSLTK
jgi:hypothetical protein